MSREEKRMGGSAWNIAVCILLSFQARYSEPEMLESVQVIRSVTLLKAIGGHI
jgi:hypothetical protein